MIKSGKFIAAALLLAVCALTQARQHEARQTKRSSVRLGNQVILIPDPEGFEEATSQFDFFKQRLATTEAPQNDMLLGHMPVSDCDLMRKGLTPTYNFYTKVSVLRIARNMVFTRERLASIAEAYRKNAGTFLDPNGPEMQRIEKHLSQRISELDSRETKIDLTKPKQLGEFDTRPDINGFLTMMTITTSVSGVEVTTPMLLTTSYVRVKGKIIFVYSLMKYHSSADVETIKQFARRWNTSILATNASR